MSESERGEEFAGAITQFPGLFEPAVHGHEPHQQTDDLGVHPANQLEGYSRRGVFTLQPKNGDVWTVLDQTYAIEERYVVDLEVMQ